LCQKNDRALLGETPALLLAPLASNAAVVEWFAFFYFSYYVLLAVGFLPALWGDRGSRAMRELFVGATVISCVGYATYTLVPGLGPYASIDFAAPLVGGVWWRAVCSTVAVGGAKLDIFPSLHTAFPVFLTLHAFAHRRRPGARRHGWLLWGFFAVNIVISTMFLRWHYAVDVVAGLALAALARRVAVHVAGNERGQVSWECRRRLARKLFGGLRSAARLRRRSGQAPGRHLRVRRSMRLGSLRRDGLQGGRVRWYRRALRTHVRMPLGALHRSALCARRSRRGAGLQR
jgi:hypothetical protein